VTGLEWLPRGPRPLNGAGMRSPSALPGVLTGLGFLLTFPPFFELFA
jgi:hypothetical protein